MVDGPPVTPTSVRRVTRHRLTRVADLRGTLTVGEFLREIPFQAKRTSWSVTCRARKCAASTRTGTVNSFWSAFAARFSAIVDDGSTSEEIELNDSNQGLYMPPMTWAAQGQYSPDVLLLVFASEYYDPADYVRDYRLSARWPCNSDQRARSCRRPVVCRKSQSASATTRWPRGVKWTVCW